MTSTDSEVSGMTTHRIEALTDGIFAVAMATPGPGPEALRRAGRW